MLLADSHITMVVGVDVHVTTAPPFNPIHPYIGMVMDPADYIPFLGTNVSVNGLKRGVSDTGGMIIPLMRLWQARKCPPPGISANPRVRLPRLL